jgi:DNA-binding CsgD family transcriptional regulator/PAS domain-containing protein
VQHSQDEGFLDLLYGAAVEPERWPAAMQQFADLMGGAGSWLSRLSMVDGSGAGILARIDPDKMAVYDEYYAPLNPFSNAADPVAFMAGWKPTILTEADWLPKAEMERTEYYNDFMRPQDIEWVMMIRLAAHGLDISSLTLTRPRSGVAFGRSELGRARRYHGHLRRAFRLTEALTGSGLADDELETRHAPQGEAVFLLDDDGHLRRMNAAAERLLSLRDELKAVEGRLTAPADAAGRLEALIAAAGDRSQPDRTGGSMSLRTTEARPPLAVTVAPARSDRLAVFRHRPAVIVCVSQPGLEDEVRLTARERDALSWVAQGKSDWEIAVILGLSETTVRFHVDNARRKLGAVNRAQAVARLLSGPRG